MDFESFFTRPARDGYRLGGSRFSSMLKAFGFVYSSNSSLQSNWEDTGRIVLPSDCLQQLQDSLGSGEVLTFRLFARSTDRMTHVGVAEFSDGTPDIMYVPRNVLNTLGITDNAIVDIERVTDLPDGDIARLQAQSVDFLELPDPKASLERCLSKHVCLTVGDMISFTEGGKIYELEVTDLEPAQACKILNVDLKVEFDDPIGYVRPPTPPKPKPWEQFESDSDSDSDGNPDDDLDNPKHFTGARASLFGDRGFVTPPSPDEDQNEEMEYFTYHFTAVIPSSDGDLIQTPREEREDAMHRAGQSMRRLQKVDTFRFVPKPQGAKETGSVEPANPDASLRSSPRRKKTRSSIKSKVRRVRRRAQPMEPIESEAAESTTRRARAKTKPFRPWH